MKRLLISICALLLVLLSQQNFAQEKVKMKDDKTKIKNGDSKMKEAGMNDMSMPYKANYSSNFRMGKPEHAKMILELWKDWDDNAFDRHNYMADTVTMYFPDGSMVRGKDSALAGAKRYRGSMSSASSTLDAWMPLRSIDRNQDWVAVWGTETDTWPDGKTEKKDLHEIWRINKDGKIDFMKQFTSAHSEQ
jgi:hypothetical protein